MARACFSGVHRKSQQIAVVTISLPRAYLPRAPEFDSRYEPLAGLRPKLSESGASRPKLDLRAQTSWRSAWRFDLTANEVHRGAVSKAGSIRHWNCCLSTIGSVQGVIIDLQTGKQYRDRAPEAGRQEVISTSRTVIVGESGAGVRMRILISVAGVLMISVANAADVEAGKAIVQTVCAACHGANGVSVSDSIPNLAAQKAAYIESQLKALKDGSRKNQIMGAIAAQLGSDDIANVAAYFASQPGAPATAKSDFLPNLSKTGVTFPENYKDAFTKYYTINFPATRQVRYYFANDVALQAAKAGKSLPDGSVLLAEVYSAKLDAEKKPILEPTASSCPTSSSPIPPWHVMPVGARTFPRCCATRTGTTRSSPPPSNRGLASIRPSAWRATSHSTRRALFSRWIR